MSVGRIHSFESCGTVDGPGIRFIIFLQGCLMSCMYCHNRDTWDTHEGKEVSVTELIEEAKSYRHFMKASGGGITCSGGEAMLQPEFVRDFFQVLAASDLVMLDIKHMKDEIHHDFIGVSNRRTLDFARYLHKIGKKTWIRYVIVPGYTDDEESAHMLGDFIKDMDNIEKVELLPYHQLGAHKWEAMGLKYPLDGVNPPSKETMEKMVAILSQYHDNVRY